MSWFNPFASNVSIITHPDSPRSTRPPAYTSTATAVPAYTPNEPPKPSAQDHSESVRSSSASSSVAYSDSNTAFDHVKSSNSSLTDTISAAKSSEITRPAGPRYIYYRVYAEDGAIPSTIPIYSDDPYLARIPATFVSPPHTVTSLKRCLSAIEKIDDNIPTSLFISASSQTAMDDAGMVSILAYPGPGCTPNDPIAFVARFSGAARSSPKEVASNEDLPPSLGPTPFETRYLHYRVYQTHCVIRSKQPATSNDHYIGRISVDFVPPPHTTASIMRCILRTEQLNTSKPSQLFMNISSQSPMAEKHISMLTTECPGSAPEDAILAFVQPPAPVTGSALYPAFTKRVWVKYPWKPDNRNPSWLTTTVGQTLYTTHDLPQKQPWVSSNGSTHQRLAHAALDGSGTVGFVTAGSGWIMPC